jgi:hypothetical protein
LAWTGAVTEIEGSSGGGLVPWALIGGLGTTDQVGASAFYSYVDVNDFTLRSGGLAVGIEDRLELSLARQRFDAGSVLPGLTLGQDIVGAKLRLIGDAIFSPDRILPQLALGAEYKRTLDFEVVPKLLGAQHGSDVDFYLAATKMYFAAIGGRNVLLNLTVRRTRADQFGLLGFGGDRRAGYSFTPEASAAVWLAEDWLLGAEYRVKPNVLSVFREDNAFDAFLAWNPFRSITLTAAYVNLGEIAGKERQRGVYISAWIGI